MMHCPVINKIQLKIEDEPNSNTLIEVMLWKYKYLCVRDKSSLNSTGIRFAVSFWWLQHIKFYFRREGRTISTIVKSTSALLFQISKVKKKTKAYFHDCNLLSWTFHPPSPSKDKTISWNATNAGRWDIVMHDVPIARTRLQKRSSISIVTALVHSSRIANLGLW